MSGGNDHNTSAGDKYSLPVLHKVQYTALCKGKADGVVKELGLGTWSVTSLAQETSRTYFRKLNVCYLLKIRWDGDVY